MAHLQASSNALPVSTKLRLAGQLVASPWCAESDAGLEAPLKIRPQVVMKTIVVIFYSYQAVLVETVRLRAGLLGIWYLVAISERAIYH